MERIQGVSNTKSRERSPESVILGLETEQDPRRDFIVGEGPTNRSKAVDQDLRPREVVGHGGGTFGKRKILAGAALHGLGSAEHSVVQERPSLVGGVYPDQERKNRVREGREDPAERELVPNEPGLISRVGTLDGRFSGGGEERRRRGDGAINVSKQLCTEVRDEPRLPQQIFSGLKAYADGG